jgi:HlyD family secretion protein
VRVGDWTAAAEDGGRQGALLTLFDPQRLQVWVDVNQRDAGQVTVGQPVQLRADAWRDRAVPGRVAAIMPRANLQRNTVEVKIEIQADADPVATGVWLRPEMSVQVTFLPHGAARPDLPTEGTRP